MNLAARFDGRAYGGEVGVAEPVYRQVVEQYRDLRPEQVDLFACLTLPFIAFELVAHVYLH